VLWNLWSRDLTNLKVDYFGLVKLEQSVGLHDAADHIKPMYRFMYFWYSLIDHVLHIKLMLACCWITDKNAPSKLHSSSQGVQYMCVARMSCEDTNILNDLIASIVSVKQTNPHFDCFWCLFIRGLLSTPVHDFDMYYFLVQWRWFQVGRGCLIQPKMEYNVL
jgi:hypothetical protein